MAKYTPEKLKQMNAEAQATANEMSLVAKFSWHIENPCGTNEQNVRHVYLSQAKEMLTNGSIKTEKARAVLEAFVRKYEKK